MGDNDFTAGDPWGLPIEDSEEIEIEAARPDEEEASPTADELDSDPNAETGLESAAADETLADSHEESVEWVAEPEADPQSGGFEDRGWSPDDESPDGFTAGDEGEGGEVPGDGPTTEDTENTENTENTEKEYSFKAPSRTPLSQMIAAAQSVVSSVQGDQPEEAAEIADDPDAPGVVDAYETDESPGEPADEQSADVPAADVPAADVPEPVGSDEDLPEEPPSWMIVDTREESPSSETENEGQEASSDGEKVFSPLEIEASIAELATPEAPAAPFAEDRFEMPDDSDAAIEENDFGEVDMDSSPGVYSELHDLADQDERAEALLQEAAEAFGRTEEPVEDLTDDIDSYADALATELGTPDTTDTTIEPVEELTEDLTDDIDSYADALATELGTPDTTDTTIEPVEELTEDLTDDIDSYADALATELGTPDTTDTTIEPVEELTEDLTDDIDSYADALATELGTPDTTDEPTEEPVEELTEDLTDDIDSYADALATELGTPDTTDTTIEPTEELTDDIDSYADALATELGTPDTIEPTEELTHEQPEMEDHLSDDELGAALTGLTDVSADDGLDDGVALVESVEQIDEEEPVAAGWWGTESEDVLSAGSEELEAEAAPSADSDETAAVAPDEEPVSAGWWGTEPDPIPAADSAETIDAGFSEELAADDDQEDTEGVLPSLAAIGIAADHEPPVEDQEFAGTDTAEASAEQPADLIESPVEWGTRYREAHQGWIEDEDGRSTWRPIVTSGESVAGWDIDIYLGLVSGDVSIGAMSEEELASSVAGARADAVRHMLDEGLARGAHAIVGVTFTIQEVAGTVLVGASGVAVTLRTPA